MTCTISYSYILLTCCKLITDKTNLTTQILQNGQHTYFEYVFRQKLLLFGYFLLPTHFLSLAYFYKYLQLIPSCFPPTPSILGDFEQEWNILLWEMFLASFFLFAEMSEIPTNQMGLKYLPLFTSPEKKSVKECLLI